MVVYYIVFGYSKVLFIAVIFRYYELCDAILSANVVYEVRELAIRNF